MARFSIAVVSNVIGRGWSACMALAFVPVYLRVLGAEAYGLIAFYATLQAAFSIVEVGLTTTLSRELSVRSTAGPLAQKQVLRTLEAVYWTLAAAGGAVIVAGSWWIASAWIKAQALPQETVQQTIALMGLILAFQWPLGFYLGGLLGLQRQVLQNLLLIAIATLRYGGGAAILVWFSPTLRGFFLWQLGVNLGGAAVTGLVLWLAIGTTRGRVRFSGRILSEIRRFTTGMAATSAAALLWSQLDKIVLSRLLPLEAFAHYSLSALVAGSVYVLVVPVANAVLPALARTVAAHDLRATAGLYHLAAQVTAALTLPLAGVLVAFAPQILLLWTRDPTISESMAPVVRYLVLGVTLNGFVHIAHMLQLAYGHTRLTLVSHVLAICVTVPALILLAPRIGARAGAIVWLTVNLAYVIVQIPLVHQRFLKGHLKRWYVHDVGAPAAGAAVVVILAASLMPSDVPPRSMVMLLAGTAACAFCAASLLAGDMRRAMSGSIRKLAVVAPTTAPRT